MSKSELDKATGYAYRLLGIRARSVKELEGRLLQKRYKGAIVNSVMSALKENKILDDYSFARSWVESRMRNNPKGNTLLRKELRDLGVEASIIEKVLSEEKSEEDALIRALVSQKMKQLEELPKEKAKQKLFTFLARRGFNFEKINEILKETL
ncbi:MAG: regulatory protein RecX [Candidatus Omnitrophota bacterium]